MGCCATGIDSDCMFAGWLFEICNVIDIDARSCTLEGRLLRILNRSLNDEATGPYIYIIYIIVSYSLI